MSTVDQSNLIGGSNYIRVQSGVANETYPSAFTQGVTITIMGVAGAPHRYLLTLSERTAGDIFPMRNILLLILLAGRRRSARR